MRLKRAFDLLVTIPGLLLLSPLFLLIALWIKLDSHGPVFFRQTRIGKGEEPFRIFKFRTMVSDAERRGSLVTAGRDSRITRSGRVLRKLKLDELPQLFNVLRGEMSLVGPRPEVARYVALYTPEQKRVLTVPPGITGLTQVVFRDEETLLQGRTDVEKFYLDVVMPAKLKLDLSYIDTRSLGRDLQLIFQTFAAIVHSPDTQALQLATPKEL
jgi:lipopolysaccharide/colanic/teichoic acid biosynthesis glycosyltransferase